MIDRRDLGADGGEVRRRRFVVALDVPTDRRALAPPLLVGALAEVPAMPPRVPGFEAEHDVGPGEVEVDERTVGAAINGCCRTGAGRPGRDRGVGDLDLQPALRRA